MLVLGVSAYAQQTPAQHDEEIVRLSPFSVNESANMGRYQAAEASSGTRVRMNLMDSTQSISVVTNEFMQDIGTARLTDATKYVAGLSTTGIYSQVMDVMNVRGFMDIELTLDGFTQFSLANQDPIIVERIEFIKGPNAILAPQGLPGGVVNNISKKPLFTNKGYLSYQVGRYDANRAELDANYVVNDKLAVRVVAAGTDADDYGDRVFHQNVTAMPMFTYRLTPTTELTLQFQITKASASVNGGTPLSVYAVGRRNIHLQEGLPRDFNYMGRNISMHQKSHNTRFQLSSQITDKLSMRAAGNWVESDVRSDFLGPSEPFLGQTGTAADPIKLDDITGEWYWDGSFNNNPTYKLSGLKEWPLRMRGNFQNDFVYEHATATWKSQTVAGYAFSYISQHFRQRNYVDDGIYHDLSNNYTPSTYAFDPNIPWHFNSSDRYRSSQLYIYEVINLFEDRLVLSGSLSQNRYASNTHNNQTGTRPDNRAEATLPSAGFVYKITPGVSVFYGYSKQEVLGQADPGSAIPAHTRPGRQHEGGLRLRLFDGRLYATATYFDILQENLWQQDPENYKIPIPFPLKPAISTNQTSKGVEFELAWSPNEAFSLIGSYTNFKFRDDDNMRSPNVAEESAAIWASYTFTQGPLSGLRVGLGANYVGERPGDSEGRWTSPPLGYDPVRVQPRFWMPSYTIVEATASYRFNKHWHAQLTVHNLLDRDYIPGANLRRIQVSTPINPKLAVRYDF